MQKIQFDLVVGTYITDMYTLIRETEHSERKNRQAIA